LNVIAFIMYRIGQNKNALDAIKSKIPAIFLTVANSGM